MLVYVYGMRQKSNFILLHMVIQFSQHHLLKRLQFSHCMHLTDTLVQRHYFVHKGPSSQGYGFSSGFVWMWELDCEESWAPKNWCFWTVVLEKTLESPLDCKEIQPIHSEGDWSWVFFGRNDAKAETPVLWLPHVKSWLIGKDWCWEGLGAGGEGDDRGWDGWMASPKRWMWVWVNSRRWWWIERPGILRFMGSQRVGHDRDWTDWTDTLVEDPLNVYVGIK